MVLESVRFALFTMHLGVLSILLQFIIFMATFTRLHAHRLLKMASGVPFSTSVQMSIMDPWQLLYIKGRIMAILRLTGWPHGWSQSRGKTRYLRTFMYLLAAFLHAYMHDLH